MQWLTPWTIACAVLCVLALVVLFFPFIFKIDFEAGLNGAEAQLYLFKKRLKKFSKKFEGDAADSDSDGDFVNEEAVVPTYVPPKKSAEPAKVPAEVVAKAPAENKTEKQELQKGTADFIEKKEDKLTASPASSASQTSPKSEESAETKPAEPEKKSEESVEISAGSLKNSAAAANNSAETSAQNHANEKSEKKEKRSLTDTEFWTILLTPEFDDTAFWAVKKWTLCFLRLFKVQFKDCFVEGIRGDVLSMGYGAALNGILKGFPYVGAWDIRMDWTCDHELRSAGRIYASVNLCRLIGLLIATVFYGGVIAYKFWRRRAHVLKTNELPELGFIRSKILKMMAED